MKKLLIVFTALMIPFMVPLAARAQTPTPDAAAVTPAPMASAVTKDMANDYFKACNAKHDARMSAASQSEMCSCASAQVMQSLSAEDLKVLNQPGQPDRIAQDKLILDVDTPCMNFPLQDIVEAQCLQDPMLPQMQLKTPAQQLCHCVALKTGTWFTAGGRDLITKLLTANPAMTDPVGAVLDSAEFKKAVYDGRVSCVDAAPPPQE